MFKVLVLSLYDILSYRIKTLTSYRLLNIYRIYYIELYKKILIIYLHLNIFEMLVKDNENIFQHSYFAIQKKRNSRIITYLSPLICLTHRYFHQEGKEKREKKKRKAEKKAVLFKHKIFQLCSIHFRLTLFFLTQITSVFLLVESFSAIAISLRSVQR